MAVPVSSIAANVALAADKNDLSFSLDAFVRSIVVRRTIPHALFLGAGASVSSGVPSAQACIWEWKRNLFLTNNPGLEEQFAELSLPSVQRRIQQWLDKQGIYPDEGVAEEYGFYIRQCYPIADDRRAYFQEKVRSAVPYIGYRLLCHLAQSDLIRSVWTTNFDGLPARAAANFSLAPLEVGIDTQGRLPRQAACPARPTKESYCVCLCTAITVMTTSKIPLRSFSVGRAEWDFLSIEAKAINTLDGAIRFVHGGHVQCRRSDYRRACFRCGASNEKASRCYSSARPHGTFTQLTCESHMSEIPPDNVDQTEQHASRIKHLTTSIVSSQSYGSDASPQGRYFIQSDGRPSPWLALFGLAAMTNNVEACKSHVQSTEWSWKWAKDHGLADQHVPIAIAAAQTP